ncbi:MAG: hypothetical protein WA854_10165, partial [Candidatus Binataceae bacterium]
MSDWARFVGKPMDEMALHVRRHPHEHRSDAKHAHVHGIADPAYASTARGLAALKWSVAVLGIAALAQLGVVMLSGSVAVLADTIHNAADLYRGSTRDRVYPDAPEAHRAIYLW